MQTFVTNLENSIFFLLWVIWNHFYLKFWGPRWTLSTNVHAHFTSPHTICTSSGVSSSSSLTAGARSSAGSVCFLYSLVVPSMTFTVDEHGAVCSASFFTFFWSGWSLELQQKIRRYWYNVHCYSNQGQNKKIGGGGGWVEIISLSSLSFLARSPSLERLGKIPITYMTFLVSY